MRQKNKVQYRTKPLQNTNLSWRSQILSLKTRTDLRDGHVTLESPGWGTRRGPPSLASNGSPKQTDKVCDRMELRGITNLN